MGVSHSPDAFGPARCGTCVYYHREMRSDGPDCYSVPRCYHPERIDITYHFNPITGEVSENVKAADISINEYGKCPHYKPVPPKKPSWFRRLLTRTTT